MTCVRSTDRENRRGSPQEGGVSSSIVKSTIGGQAQPYVLCKDAKSQENQAVLGSSMCD